LERIRREEQIIKVQKEIEEQRKKELMELETTKAEEYKKNER